MTRKRAKKVRAVYRVEKYARGARLVYINDVLVAYVG